MKHKRCTGECGQIKPISEFPKRKDSIDGHRHDCKICHSAHVKRLKEAKLTPEEKEARVTRKQVIADNKAQRRHNSVARPMYHAAIALRNMNPEHHEKKKQRARDFAKERRATPEGRAKEEAIRIRLRDEGYFKKYREDNKEHLREMRRQYRQKKKNNPDVKLKKKLRKLISESLNSHGSPKYRKTLEILDCTWEEAKERIGPPQPGTHIDHIIPEVFAEKGNTEELEALNCIWNLRRISAEENMAKSDSLPPRELLHPNLPPLALEIYKRNVNA